MINRESHIDRLLNARAQIDEQVRQSKASLTVLFTDVVGSTAYFERFGDTAGLAVMHRHAGLGASTVTEFGGRVIKTIGDSVMAEFDEPANGVHAAVELQHRVQRLNQTLPERDRLQLRIGLNHGSCFRVGNDVYGDAVNVAARVAKHTGPAQILISKCVHDAIAADPTLQCCFVGNVKFKGKEATLYVFEVIWADATTYGDLRQSITTALASGELVSPGAQVEDFLPPTMISPPATPGETQPAFSTPPPTSLDVRYDVLCEVGSGGMGIVYKARDRETGEIVALKVIRPDVAKDLQVIERFKSELRLARKVTHKNVCRTFDLNHFDGVYAIAMEFVEGENLRRILARRGPTSVGRGLQWAKQICAALEAAHSAGIVHRDLKPENIVVTGEGLVKVMDFGIARPTTVPVTQAGSFVGTPGYAAPEQIRGEQVDTRTDIYASGAVFYEIFTGASVFQADSGHASLMKHLHETPPPPREIEPYLPEFLERIILKCLEKEPCNRFASIADLQSALDEKPIATPVVEPAREVVPEPHLLRWNIFDWALTAMALLGVLLFIRYAAVLVPQSLARVNVEPSAARREAARLLEGVGWGSVKSTGVTFLQESAALLDAPPPMFPYALLRASKDPVADLALLARDPMPFTWGVDVKTEQPEFPFVVLIDSDGQPVGMKQGFWMKDFNQELAKYVALPATSPEQELQLATKFLGDFFGIHSARLTLEDATSAEAFSFQQGLPTIAGIRVQRYKWVGLDQDRWQRKDRYSIEIIGNRLYGASRAFSQSQEQKAINDGITGSKFHAEICLAVFGVLFAPIFFAGRIYRKLFRWRSVLWFSTPFLIYALVGITSGLITDAPDPIDPLPVMAEEAVMTVLGCVICGLLVAYYFFTVNYLLANQWTTKWSTFQSLCERRFHLASGVPWAVVRGAALAFIALGACAVLRYVAVRFRLAPWVPVLGLSDYPDTSLPGLILVFTAALRSFAVALFLSFSSVLLRKIVRHPALLVGCGALFWLLTCSYFFPWNPTPFLWFEWVIVFAFALIAYFVFVYYDFLTLWFFLFSFYLTIDNYTMWKLFQNVNNLAYTVVFVVWGAVVALCVYSISRRRLTAAWQRLSLAFE